VKWKGIQTPVGGRKQEIDKEEGYAKVIRARNR
jgi:hypothetical protein